MFNRQDKWLRTRLKKTALILFGTGEAYYSKFLQDAVDGAKKYFPADILLFTDSPINYGVTRQVHLQHQGWPNVTLLRYHTFLTEQSWLSQYNYTFYLDTDMRIVKPITNEILSEGITVTMHPYFSGPKQGSPDTNPLSTAYLPLECLRQYVMGSFQGGTTSAFLEMARIISKNVDTDAANGVTALWYDESHLNRFVYDHPPSKILTPAYAALPCDLNESTYIVTLDKGEHMLHQ